MFWHAVTNNSLSVTYIRLCRRIDLTKPNFYLCKNFDYAFSLKDLNGRRRSQAAQSFYQMSLQTFQQLGHELCCFTQ